MKIIAGFAVFLIITALAYGAWQVSRKWNYFWSYEDMVQKTVCDMVKPEHLIKPCK